MPAPVLVWLRRDLRLDDSHAIAAALDTGAPLAFLYVLDPAMKRRGVGHAQLGFIVEGLEDLHGRLAERGGGLLVRRGDTVQQLVEVARELGVTRVCANRDEEPAADVLERAAEEALRRRLGDAAHDTVRRQFDWPVLAGRLEALCYGLADER